MPTGLRNDSIKLELKPCLQNTHVTEEGLFEKLIGAVGNEMERQQKLDSLNGLATTTNPVPLVAQVTSTNIDADYLSRITLVMNTYMGTCTEELSPDVLRATIEAVREQSHGRISWITAVSIAMTTSEPTLQELKLKPLSTQEIKEAQRLDLLINLVNYYKSTGVKPYGKHWCVTPSVLIIFYGNGTSWNLMSTASCEERLVLTCSLSCLTV